MAAKDEEVISRSAEVVPIEDDDHHSFPLIVLAVPLVFAQLVGTRHMKGQVLRLLRDPHVWLPWHNKHPWKNPTQSWWWAAGKSRWVNDNPWKNPKPWTPNASKKNGLF